MPYEDDELSLIAHQLHQRYVKEFDLDNPEFVQRHGLNNKIHWRSLESGVPEEEIREDLRNNRTLQWWYVIDPKRQNIGETWITSKVSEINGVTNFAHPGPGTLFLVQGGVMTSQQLRDQGVALDTRGIDFTWNYNQLEFYATQKYTGQGDGGGQQQDYDEMRDWIQIANRNDPRLHPERRFIVLVDGSSWTDVRINELKRLCQEENNVFISRVTGLEKFLSSLKN